MLVRLQAARKIAHAHDGDIEMEPTREGSRFTLTVPR
jgi:signal transduction histidine kinase